MSKCPKCGKEIKYLDYEDDGECEKGTYDLEERFTTISQKGTDTLTFYCPKCKHIIAKHADREFVNEEADKFLEGV